MDPLRERNFEWVYQHVSGMYPWSNIGSGVFGVGNPTRGGVRNAAVEWAENQGADVVVLCDSDLLPTEWALSAAITAAYEHGGLQFAYNQYRALNQVGTALLMDGDPTLGYCFLESEAQGGLGGVMAIRPDQWWEAGGSPELEGWGFEDVIFAVQARTLLATDCAWHTGWLTHLYHPTECRVGSDQYNKNIAICKMYEAADGNKEEITKLIRGRS
jgi:hypothetical protein